MDSELSEAIDRCQRGDIDALEPIYRHYKNLVFRLCVRMSHDNQQALDWTQEIFIRVFEKIGSFRGKASFSSWLYRVATNYCLDQLKNVSATRAVPLDTSLESQTENPVNSILKKEERKLLQDAINDLDPRLRTVLILKDMEQLSYAEISQILDIPEGSVGSRLNQARKELAERLKSLGQKRGE